MLWNNSILKKSKSVLAPVAALVDVKNMIEQIKSVDDILTKNGFKYCATGSL